jgi:hypothetical protein
VLADCGATVANRNGSAPVDDEWRGLEQARRHTAAGAPMTGLRR